ncbi:sensor histidine kinase [Microtetraspora fusca]|uniref:sensor histidine kinase n=1 Tax=Microtetraspora fusca TaxID=1997 RepID=UPI00082F32C4|nr:sensor histidine kinase [Microtetraspora fusca]
MRFDLRRHATVPDAVLGLILAVLLSAGAATVPGLGPSSYAAIAVGCLALAVRRQAPTMVLLVTTACMLAYAVGADPAPPAAFPVMIAVYTAVRYGHRNAAAIGGLVFLAGSLAASLTADAAQPPKELVERTILLLGWFVAAGVGGTVSRHRQAYLEQAEQRAAEAERTREETALRRAGEERLRIARELHDSLTHSISVIKVQAGVAVHLARKRGEEVPGALLAIQEAGADAMRELRATLEVLRDSDDPAGNGLERVDDLVARVGAAGLPTTVTVTGSARALPAHVERAAYRIIQEALTNASRHAGPATATVTLAYGTRELTVQIDDDGVASPSDPPTPGNGLTGMRERVTALGGRLHAHPRPHGGFTVRAELPTEDLS